MKKFLIFIITLFAFSFGQIVVAHEGVGEHIERFDTTIQVKADSSIEVEERILYNFGDEERHGIFREIPFKYAVRGGNYELRIEVKQVVDEAGKAQPYIANTYGPYVRIKIGDPDVIISGRKTYVITYVVERAIRYFSDHDELYWNVIGPEWSVPISQAGVRVLLPQSMETSTLQAACFSGVQEATTTCAYAITPNSIDFEDEQLAPGEGLTIVAGWSKGVVGEPGKEETAFLFVRDNWILGLPVLAFAVMFWLWNKHGRDPEGRGTIVAEFEPPDNLSPAEVGAIADQGIQARDISAEIVYLATKGYLKIAREPGEGMFKKDDFVLSRVAPADDRLTSWQKKLLDALFGGGSSVHLSDLENKLATALSDIRRDLYDELVGKKYFHRNPQVLQAIGMTIGVLVGVGGGMFGLVRENMVFALSLFLTGVIIFIFGWVMPKRTREGVLAKEHILGLRKYIEVAEKDRLEFHNAPEKNPEHFEKLLPYAMALKVEKAWAKKFGDLNSSPSWYSDPSLHAFNAVLLTNSLGEFSAFASSTMSPRSAGGSGFGGGGFSGGGFGGGGGGSW